MHNRQESAITQGAGPFNEVILNTFVNTTQYMIDIYHRTAYTGAMNQKDKTMPYERTYHIEQQFRKAVDLIANNKVNARQLATFLGVSRPTAQRMISELKRRGYKIRSVHDDHGWHYELLDK